MLQPPCAKNYLENVNNQGDWQNQYWTDIATHTKAKTIKKNDTNNFLSVIYYDLTV